MSETKDESKFINERIGQSSIMKKSNETNDEDEIILKMLRRESSFTRRVESKVPQY